ASFVGCALVSMFPQRWIAVRVIQEMLKPFHELRHMQAVNESVVNVDRYRHRASSGSLSNFAEGDQGRGIAARQIARVRNEGEVKPGKNGRADQVRLRIAFDIFPLTHAIDFDSRLPYEILHPHIKLIMAK